MYGVQLPLRLYRGTMRTELTLKLSNGFELVYQPMAYYKTRNTGTRNDGTRNTRGTIGQRRNNGTRKAEHQRNSRNTTEQWRNTGIMEHHRS